MGVRLEPADGGTRFKVTVRPGSSRDEVVGPLGDALKVAVSAPAEKGKANDALCELLAEVLGVRSRDVAILRGATARDKVVRVNGIGPKRVGKKLG